MLKKYKKYLAPLQTTKLENTSKKRKSNIQQTNNIEFMLRKATHINMLQDLLSKQTQKF